MGCQLAVALADFQLRPSCPCFPSAEIKGKHHIQELVKHSASKSQPTPHWGGSRQLFYSTVPTAVWNTQREPHIATTLYVLRVHSINCSSCKRCWILSYRQCFSETGLFLGLRPAKITQETSISETNKKPPPSKELAVLSTEFSSLYSHLVAHN